MGWGATDGLRATRGSALAQDVSVRPPTLPGMVGRGRNTSRRLVETMRARECTTKEIRDHLKTLNYSPSRIWQLTTACLRGEAVPLAEKSAATSPTSRGGRGRETALDVVRGLIAEGTPLEGMRAALRSRGFKSGRIYQLMNHRHVLSLYGLQVDYRRAPSKKKD